MSTNSCRQGFDYTYDKRLYDRLANGEIGEIKSHSKPRTWTFCAQTFASSKIMTNPAPWKSSAKIDSDSAAALICTLPGATLLHQGQLSGRRIKLPVQINRGAAENSLPVTGEILPPSASTKSAPRSTARANGNCARRKPIQSSDYTQDNLIAYTWRTRRDDAPGHHKPQQRVVAGAARPVRLLAVSRLASAGGSTMCSANHSSLHRTATAMLRHGLLLEVPPCFRADILRVDAEDYAP